MELIPNNLQEPNFVSSRTEYLCLLTFMRYTNNRFSTPGFNVDYDKLTNAPNGMYSLPDDVCKFFSIHTKQFIYNLIMKDLKDDEHLYCNFGLYEDSNGQMMYKNKLEVSEDELSKIPFMSYGGIVDNNGEIIRSVHKVSKSRCLAFISFLDNCNGFTIM